MATLLGGVRQSGGSGGGASGSGGTITYEQFQDYLNLLIIAGTNVTISYDDVANRYVISADELTAGQREILSQFTIALGNWSDSSDSIEFAVSATDVTLLTDAEALIYATDIVAVNADRFDSYIIFRVPVAITDLTYYRLNSAGHNALLNHSTLLGETSSERYYRYDDQFNIPWGQTYDLQKRAHDPPTLPFNRLNGRLAQSQLPTDTFPLTEEDLHKLAIVHGQIVDSWTDAVADDDIGVLATTTYPESNKPTSGFALTDEIAADTDGFIYFWVETTEQQANLGDFALQTNETPVRTFPLNAILYSESGETRRYELDSAYQFSNDSIVTVKLVKRAASERYTISRENITGLELLAPAVDAGILTYSPTDPVAGTDVSLFVYQTNSFAYFIKQADNSYVEIDATNAEYLQARPKSISVQASTVDLERTGGSLWWDGTQDYNRRVSVSGAFETALPREIFASEMDFYGTPYIRAYADGSTIVIKNTSTLRLNTIGWSLAVGATAQYTVSLQYRTSETEEWITLMTANQSISSGSTHSPTDLSLPSDVTINLDAGGIIQFNLLVAYVSGLSSGISNYTPTFDTNNRTLDLTFTGTSTNQYQVQMEGDGGLDLFDSVTDIRYNLFDEKGKRGYRRQLIWEEGSNDSDRLTSNTDGIQNLGSGRKFSDYRFLQFWMDNVGEFASTAAPLEASAFNILATEFFRSMSEISGNQVTFWADSGYIQFAWRSDTTWERVSGTTNTAIRKIWGIIES